MLQEAGNIISLLGAEKGERTCAPFAFSLILLGL